VPFTSGFFSKELILKAAKDDSPALFWIAAFVAVLTAFYMTRLIVIALLGKPRTEHAEHAKEVGALMWVPLAILAAMALISGFLPDMAPAAPDHAGEFHVDFLLAVSLVALALGAGCAFALYRGRHEDPLSLTVLREKLYIDHFYDKLLVPTFTNALAAITHFFDELIINGLLVGGLSRVAASVGKLCRTIQSGKLQYYAFAVGIGGILVIYLTVFH